MIKQDIRIYMYMLPIADQTAGPIGLTFFVDTHGLSKAKNKLNYIFFYLKKCPRATPGPLASI